VKLKAEANAQVEFPRVSGEEGEEINQIFKLFLKMERRRKERRREWSGE
jgi:hypothetical protein